MRFLVLIGVVLPGLAGAAIPNPPSLIYDSRGRPARVSFDQGNRVVLGGTGSVLVATGMLDSPQPTGIGLFSIDERGGCLTADESCWKHAHHFFDLSVDLAHLQLSRWPTMTATLFSGRYIHHRTTPFLTLPTNPPFKMTIPFNFGVMVKAGQLSTTVSKSKTVWGIGVLDATLLLDFWRHPDVRRWFALGVGMRYDLLISKDTTGLKVAHLLSPFTVASALFHYENDKGFHQVDIQLEAWPHWSHHGGWEMGFQSRGRYELILMALNDQPVSWFVEVDQRYWSQWQTEVRALSGLKLSLQLN